MRNRAFHRSICLLLDIYSLELAAPSNVVFLCKMAVQRGMLSRRAGMQNEASARACPLCTLERTLRYERGEATWERREEEEEREQKIGECEVVRRV